MGIPRLKSWEDVNRRELLGTLVGAAPALAGCSAIRAKGPTQTGGKQLELWLYNFQDVSVTVDVAVSQGETTVYAEALSVEGAAEGHFRSIYDGIYLPEVAATTVSGTIPESDQAISATMPYKKLPRAYGFRFGLDDDGELGLWRNH